MAAPKRAAPPPAARAPFDSSVRFVDEASAPPRALDALNDKLLNLTMDLVCLEAAIAEAAPETPVARWLEKRGVALSLTKDALTSLFAAADEGKVGALLSDDAPLTSYLQGLFLYCDAVTRALVRFAGVASEGALDWTALRERVSQATHWYFDGLPREVRAEALGSGAAPEVLDTLDDLFFAACFVAEGLEERPI